MSKIIRARAPLRLGLAGGGTDVSPYCDIYGGYVLNATIDRYAYAVIKQLDSDEVQFVAQDQKEEIKYKLNCDIDITGTLILHKAVYKYFIQKYNQGKKISIQLSTFCDAPAGSGLGSSSTLVVAMIRAFVELMNVPYDDHKISELAFQIERIECGLRGGRQDQYSATFGGFNFMEFYKDNKAVINPLRIKPWIIYELEASLVLYFTGVSRESAKIIADQSNNIKIGLNDAIDAMHGIKNEALVMKEFLLKGDFIGLVNSMRQGWENKKKSSNSVSNKLIDEVFDAAIFAGAQAGKVSGAGGGGFMLFFVPTEKRLSVINALEKFGGQVSNCHFTKYGAEAWVV
jgi:D-glycero-alpha-D-manno-heptose-7-phosphate kinase